MYCVHKAVLTQVLETDLEGASPHCGYSEQKAALARMSQAFSEQHSLVHLFCFTKYTDPCMTIKGEADFVQL